MPYKENDRVIKAIDFESIKVGDCAELKHVLTREDVHAFAALTGDFNPLHVDEAFARKTLFQKPVVHGMLSASFVSTMIGTLLPGGGALWMSQTFDFLRPAYAGDTLTVISEVKQKSESTRVLVLKIAVKNQHGDELISGESTVKVLKLRNEEKQMNSDKKKVVLITGASRGIGAATAQKLARDGHAVVVNYVSAKAEAEKVVAKIAQAGGKAMACQADIADMDAVKKIFGTANKTFGTVNAVVHCAGPENAPQSFENLQWDSFQKQIDVHLKGIFHCAQLALPDMVKAGSGDMVFMGTIYTDGTPPAQQARYITAKAALTALARCLAVEYGPKGIKVNVVSAGMTQTDMIALLPDKVKMLAKMQTPLRKLAEADDIADAIAFLLSPAARHITGETIRVCGGAVMQ
jgi:3-oxoacyl-[acyl-carrier protein] reductase